MHKASLIVRTKLTPPRPQKYILHRPRLTHRLLEAAHYRLTILQAGTGYGKSTALAALNNQDQTAIWYRLDAEDNDPQRLLAHLLYAFSGSLSGYSDEPLAVLESWSSHRSTYPWTAVIDALLNECVRVTSPDTPLFLIVDDAHLLNQANVPLHILDRLIGLAPANLHVILAARQPVALPSLLNWRIKGEVLEIEQSELAFTPQEIDDLFRNLYGHPLTLEQAALLIEKLEGWPIALQLVWKHLQKDDGATIAEAVAQLSGSTGDLFAYLTQEVLAQLPEDIQAFLKITAVLRQMTAQKCDYLRGSRDSKQILDYLLENALFVVDQGEGHLRYHHLFRELLLQQLAPAAAQSAHNKAAAFALQNQDTETAIYHWLQAGAFEEAAVQLETLGREMVRVGRLGTLAGWIGALPAEILANHPPLLTYLGDIARLHSRFDEALGWYQQAERRSRALNNLPALGQALRGMARFYLDTVNPNQAERLLQEALRLSDGLEDRESRARLCELMSENLLNLGRSEEARHYQAQAQELRQEGPTEVELPVRILLRTGRLAEARRLLEEKAEAERREPVLRPRAHRETLLLLSLVLAFLGEQGAAMETAVEGTERGRALGSDFVTAVGFMRQGHAWMLAKNDTGYREAVRCFEEAIRISDKLDVPRLKVEASWGLCQAHGFRGDIETAVQAAQQGIAIAREAGDEWIEANISATLGAAYVQARQHNPAQEWLAKAYTSFRECGDPHGEAITLLWQCLNWHDKNDKTRLKRDLIQLLTLCRTHHYTMLLTQTTLLGPIDTRQVVPLLLFARDNCRDSQAEYAYAKKLLAQMGFAALEIHPGYQLRIQTFGLLKLWLGRQEPIHEIPEKAWNRKRALQLFLLFLSHRGQMLHREQICDMLWPDATYEESVRDFKIAYSAMCNVLEPHRRPHAPSSFIVRTGLRYGLRPEADIWLDSAEFERLIAEGDRQWGKDSAEAVRCYRTAVQLYQGNFLQAYPYDVWLGAERDRLLALYLRTAERLAQLLTDQQMWEEASDVCHAILARDDSWEAAYRLLMQIYAEQGNWTFALQIYDRCQQTLRDQWGMTPAPETMALYEQIRQRRTVSE